MPTLFWRRGQGPEAAHGQHLHHCVIVILRVAVWLIAPVPLVEAVRVIVLVPAGVPEMPEFPPLLLPHDVSPAANATSANMPRKREPRSTGVRRAAKLKIIPKQGSRSAYVR